MRGREFWLCDDERSAALFPVPPRITTETSTSFCTIVALTTQAPTMTKGLKALRGGGEVVLESTKD